jgi:hypothetical protein
MRVKSINYTGFFKEKKLKFSNCFFKKKTVHVTCTVHFSEQCSSGAMLHCSAFPLQEVACGPAEILVGPIIKNQFFLLN